MEPTAETVAEAYSHKPLVGYKLSRPDCPGWMFCGVTPEEVAACLKNEIDSHEGLGPDEIGQMILEPYMTSQAEIDAMPEFQGW